MQIEALQEFVVFARYLNYTKAAEELHMSQSNLSKHIRQLELDLGFPLLTRNNNRISVSDEGNLFLGEITSILEKYNKLVEKCRNRQQSLGGSVHIQEAPYFDTASMAFYSAIAEVKRTCPDLSVDFSQIHKMDIIDALQEGVVDFALIYSFDGHINDDRVNAAQLMESPVYIWVDENHPLALRDHVYVRDLKEVPIMASSGAYTPLKDAIADMCHSQGFEPELHMTSFSSMIEFIFASPSDAAYIVPDVAQGDTARRSRPSMVYRRIEDVDFKVMLVYKAGELQKPVETTRDIVVQMMTSQNQPDTLHR